MGAVPKKKHTKSRTGKRRGNKSFNLPNLTRCPSCGKLRFSHKACPHCGHYRVEQDSGHSQGGKKQ